MSNSSIFNMQAKVLNSLQDLQFNEREFQSAALKALADNANDVRGTVSNSLSADLRQRPGL